MNVFYEKKTEPLTYFEQGTLSPLPHLHNEIEIIYVKEGEANAYADSTVYNLRKGDIFIAFPNQIHYYQTVERGDFNVYIILPDIIFGLKNQFNSYIPRCNKLICDEETKILFLKAAEHYNTESNTVSVGYLNIILGNLIPLLKLTPNLSSDNSTIRSILDYCYEHFTEDISLSLVAEELHLNKYYISHLIKRKLDLGFNDYINLLRVRSACKLLIDSDKKIADISEEVGYGTIRTLNRTFKQIMNLTPLEYRNQSKKLK